MVSPFVGTPPPSPKRPRPPNLVFAAGIIWSAIGALGILGALVLTNMLRGAAGMVAAAIPALISLAFLYVGVSTIRGKAPDTLGNGVGSIGIGVLGIVAVVLSLVEGMSVISTVIQSLALIVAGWLALAARGDYQRWRERHADRL